MAQVFVSALFWPFLEFLTLETNTIPFAIMKHHLVSFIVCHKDDCELYFRRH